MLMARPKDLRHVKREERRRASREPSPAQKSRRCVVCHVAYRRVLEGAVKQATSLEPCCCCCCIACTRYAALAVMR